LICSKINTMYVGDASSAFSFFYAADAVAAAYVWAAC
jgi:hypothetical protein